MDIKEVAEKKLLLKYKPDVIVGGPPCQGFSMAGARIRQNFIDDPRNFLFRHYFEIVQQLRPSYFIIENVKGLLTMDKGAIIDEIIRTFKDPLNFGGSQYHISLSVINATRFGIPQVRERVVMIGSLNSEMDLEADIEHIRKMILSEDKHFFSSYTVWDAISNLSEAHSENGVVHVKPTNRYQKSLSTIDYVCFNHTLPSHAKKTIQRMNKLKQGENFQQLDEIIKSVHSGSYGRLKNG